MSNQNNNNRKLIAIMLFVMAFSTLIPMSNARETSLLGYRAVCSFSPISSLILVGLGALILHYTKKNSK